MDTTKVIEPTAVVETPAVKPPVTIKSLEQLKAEMGKALAEGNDTEMIAISKLILKQKSDVEKAEANKLAAEAEALSGVRVALSVKIWETIGAEMRAELLKVKATGFTYKMDGTPDGISYKNVLLTVPAVKTKKTGGGGGGAGITVASQTGMTRSALIAEYATDDEKAVIAKAREDAVNRGGNPNSSGWSAEKPIIKAILVRNPELVKH